MLYENNNLIKELKNIYIAIKKISGEEKARSAIKAELERRKLNGEIKLSPAKETEDSGSDGY